MAIAPVRFETIGTVGAWKDRDSATCRNWSSMASMCGEWNAWLTASRLVGQPLASHCAPNRITVASSPEITVTWGPFTRATPTAAA